MATYKGKTVSVNASAEAVAAKFADLSVLEKSLDNVPESMRQQIGDAKFERDAIVIANPQVGQLKFEVVERTESLVKFASTSLLPMTMSVHMTATSETTCDVSTTIELDIPMMLKPLIGPQIQKAADQFGVMMANIAQC